MLASCAFTDVYGTLTYAEARRDGFAALARNHRLQYLELAGRSGCFEHGIRQTARRHRIADQHDLRD